MFWIYIQNRIYTPLRDISKKDKRKHHSAAAIFLSLRSAVKLPQQIQGFGLKRLCNSQANENRTKKRQDGFVFVCIFPQSVGLMCTCAMILLMCVNECVRDHEIPSVCGSYSLCECVWLWLHHGSNNSLGSFVTIRLYLNSINHKSNSWHTHMQAHSLVGPNTESMTL